ncbi:expressed unknown protein [Seminavis robusta]|uniref:Uncharacterized protein n=1 Tax=Seminavis robusta TaxID=568900 RepID=A0A9N8H2D5_9STRA|nr:expressed unknown protein [Seminavis robusta]|eukprot:Sro62_g035600.1 n/a (1228) ;mRNA; f:127631-131314
MAVSLVAKRRKRRMRIPQDNATETMGILRPLSHPISAKNNTKKFLMLQVLAILLLLHHASADTATHATHDTHIRQLQKQQQQTPKANGSDTTANANASNSSAAAASDNGGGGGAAASGGGGGGGGGGTSSTETSLDTGGPSCLIVGDEFVCDVNMVLHASENNQQQQQPQPGNSISTNGNNTAGSGGPTAGSGSASTDSEVVVEAALTCPFMPFNNNTMNNNGTTTVPAQGDTMELLLAVTDPKTCGCTAALSYNHNSREAKQCPCHYCIDPTGAPNNNPQLAIDCSAHPSDPFVQGRCQRIACDGSCINTPKNTTTATPQPTTTPATPPPTTAAPTKAPTLAPTTATTIPPTASQTTLAPTASATTTITNRFPWWIPAAFYITNTGGLTAEQLLQDEAGLEGLQSAFRDLIQQQVIDVLLEPTNPTARRFLQQSTTLVEYASLGTALYDIHDADCPPTLEMRQAQACQVVFGRFQLLLDSNNPSQVDLVESEYTVATDVAVDTQLQALLDDNNNNPLGIQIVRAESVARTPPSDSCNFCANPNNDAPFPPTDGFDCAQVATLYAQASADECINIASTRRFQLKLPGPLREFVRQQLPLDFKAQCGCPMTEEEDVMETTRTCPVFCPADKRVPEADRDVVVDEANALTCGMLDDYSNAVADLTFCDALQRHGEVCCTESTTISTLPPQPQSQNNLTASGDRPSTPEGAQVVTIPSYFRVYNLRELTADVVMLSPDFEGLQKSYAIFVERVVRELTTEEAEDDMNATATTTADSAANATRYLRRGDEILPDYHYYDYHQRRRLQIVLDTTTIHFLNDTKCPKNYPSTAICANVTASYDLFLLDGEHNMTTIDDYTNYTQEAIDQGLLNETMEVIDPYSSLVILGSLPIPPPDNGPPPPSPQEIADEGGYDEFYMIGIGVGVAIIVFCLVAIICASDMTGAMPDDSDVDPWEKEPTRPLAKEKAPSSKKSMEDPHAKTERQEYEHYRAQVEELVEEKTPEELDNVDELMDLFFERELILIATLKHMPDANDIPQELEAPPSINDDSMAPSSINNTITTEARFDDSMFWASEDGSSGEFAEESTTMFAAFAKPGDEESESEDEAIKRSSTIEEGDESADLTDSEMDSSSRVEAAENERKAKKVQKPVSDSEADSDDEPETAKESAPPKKTKEATPEPKTESPPPTPESESPPENDSNSDKAASETWDDEDANEEIPDSDGNKGNDGDGIV